MIAIINYDPKSAAGIKDFLETHGIKCKETVSESLICSADKIILPPAENLEKALKKILVMNLFNVLKIVSKPILGIENGVLMMCDRFPDADISCLSFFKKIENMASEEIDRDYITERMHKSRDLDIFEGVNFEDPYLFDTSLKLGMGEDTAAYFRIDESRFSALLAKGYYYGFLFHPLESGDNGERLLLNFCNSAL